MNKEDIKSREIIISRNGKPLFAVRIDSNLEGNRDANYVFVEDGDIKFSSSWMNSIIPFQLSNESHRLAKEIFTIGLQAAVKTKVMELKQLESILKDINLEECLGNVLIDNTKVLLEVKENFNSRTREIIEITEKNMDKTIKKVEESSLTAVKKVEESALAEETVRKVVKDAIIDTVKPIAVKKNKNLYKEEL